MPESDEDHRHRHRQSPTHPRSKGGPHSQRTEDRSSRSKDRSKEPTLGDFHSPDGPHPMSGGSAPWGDFGGGGVQNDLRDMKSDHRFADVGLLLLWDHLSGRHCGHSRAHGAHAGGVPKREKDRFLLRAFQFSDVPYDAHSDPRRTRGRWRQRTEGGGWVRASCEDRGKGVESSGNPQVTRRRKRARGRMGCGG